MGFLDWLTGDSEEESEKQNKSKPTGATGGLKFISRDILNEDDEDEEQEDEDLTTGHEALDPDTMGTGDGSLKTWHYERNKYNIIPDDDSVKKPSSLWTKAPDWQSLYHRHGEGNEYNEKFLSPDGHREVVYDPFGSRVTSDENMGTYNFGGDDSPPGAHAVKDVLPYWRWGNTPADKTPWPNRMFGPSHDETFRFGEEP